MPESTVTTTGSFLVRFNSRRKSLTILNRTTDTIAISFDLQPDAITTSHADFTILQNELFEAAEFVDGQTMQHDVSIISSGASTSIFYKEGIEEIVEKKKWWQAWGD